MCVMELLEFSICSKIQIQLFEFQRKRRNASQA